MLIHINVIIVKRLSHGILTLLHMQRYTQVINHIKCNYCNKVFSCNRYLIRHSKIHLAKNHINVIILTRFSQKKKDVINHLRTYTLERNHMHAEFVT